MNVLEGFGCVFLYCVTGTGYKIVFGTGTNLIVETSKFLMLVVFLGVYIHLYSLCIMSYYLLYCTCKKLYDQ